MSDDTPAPDTAPTPETPTPTPSAEIAVRAAGFGMTPHERYLYAQSLADARQLPAMLRGSVADVYLRVEYGVSIGVPPISAISAVHIVDGKPTASAGLMSALIRKAGHRFRVWTEPDPKHPGEVRAIATVHRAEDPDFEYRSEWSIDDAVAANLVRVAPDGTISAVKDRSAWSTYRRAMLKARATTEVARDSCEDVLLGVHYTPEELGAPVDETGEPILEGEVVNDTHAPTPPPAAPAATPTPPSTPAGPVVDPEVVGAALRDALSRPALVEALVELGLAEPNPKVRGGVGYRADLLSSIAVADPSTGEILDAWTLIGRLGKSLPADDPKGDDPPTKAEPTPEGPKAGPGGVVRDTHAPAGVWEAQPDVEADRLYAPGEPGAPADPTACHVMDCLDPESHGTNDHAAFLAYLEADRADGDVELGANGEPIVDAVVVEDDETDPTDRGLSPEPTPPPADMTPAARARQEAREHAARARAAAEERGDVDPKDTPATTRKGNRK